MFELITQIIILAAIYFLVRFVLLSFIERKYLTWFGGIVLVLLMVLAFLEPNNRTVGLLWGILSFPLRPLGLVLILLAYAVRKGYKQVAGPQIMAALLILLVCSLPVTAYLLTAQSEQRPVLETRGQQDVTAARGVEAIVVLGDGSSPTDPTYRIRSQLSTGEDGISVGQRSRLLYAAQLYSSQQARGNDPLVIVSVGPRPVEQDGISETASITDLLTSRTDQVPTPTQNRVNLTALLEDLVQLYRAEAEIKQIDLKGQILEHLEVFGDLVQLTRLFTNLISNALRYTLEQGLIEIQTHREDSQILVNVRDTGVGMAPDHLEHIFDRFWRADRSRSQGSGFGLGLAIAQGIAQNHGGSITVTSQLSIGSCFTVRLPVNGSSKIGEISK